LEPDVKIYTVARTVIFYFDVEASSEQQALEEVEGLGIGAAYEQEQVTQEVIYQEEKV
jgi:hypothetical protein